MKLIKITDIINMLGVSRSLVYEWVANDKIPGKIELNGLIRFDEADVVRWLKALKKSSQ